jgi:hypothetical protein
MQAIKPSYREPRRPLMVICPSFRGSGMFENFIWRIAIFVIALLIVTYLMLLGIITVDRLLYVNWDHELDAPMIRPVRF